MVYFIINETSRTGKGASVWSEVEALAKESGIPYEAYKTEYEGHATELAAMICKKNDADICLIVVGGDGTMNEVINGMTDFDKVRFGIIPTGSGNDFGRGLGLPKTVADNWKNIRQCIEEGKNSYKELDLGQVEWEGCKTPKLFGISSGIGLDAIVCKKALHSRLKTVLNKIHLGKLTYIFLTIITLFSMDTADACLKFPLADSTGTDLSDGEERNVILKKMIFTVAMNLRAEGGGVPMAPHANPCDGKFSVCSAHKIPKWRTFFCLPFLVAAKHENINGFSIMDGSVIHVELSKPMTLHADGEYCGEVDKIKFSCLPQKLHILK